MPRRLLRSSLPRSSRPQIQSPVVASPKTPTYMYWLASIVMVTLIVLDVGVTRPPQVADQPEKKKKVDPPAQKQTYDPLWPPPPPAADKILDLCSVAGEAVKKGPGVRRMDRIVLPSNHPSEDVVTQGSSRFSKTLYYSLFAVFDGHNGNRMSDFLDKFLPGAVLGRLAQLYSAHATVRPDYVSSEELHKRQPGLIKGLHPDMPNPSPPEEEIDQTIKDAFMEVDSFLVNSISQGVVDKQFPKEEAARLLSFAHTGSCALVGIYNNVKRTLKVALTGDSRAVLGRRVALKKDTYAYETHVLSADQNGYNPHEVERLETAHPGEEIFKNERMLGGGISRAFGNAAYKLSLEIQQRLHEEYLGDPPRSDCLTPPYFTAEPVITTTTIRKGDFVVLASDGLWDCLTNEEVVGLVGLWLETRGEEVKIGKGQGIGEGEMVMVPSGFHSSGKDHRIGVGKGKGIGWSEGSDGGKTNKEDGTTIWERTDLPVTSLKPDETQMYKSWQATKRFINVDDNAAVHLARSALGGADKELTETLLQLLPPRSRRFRDDISILVVFFD